MKKQKLTLWGAGLVAAVIVVMAVLVALTPTQPTPQTSGGSGQAAPETTPSSKSGCNAPTGDTSTKPALPSDLRWEASKGWTWPVSDTYGPTKTAAGRGVCFSRSPLGAALALMTFLGNYGSAGDPRAVIEQYVADSPGRTALLAKAADATASQSPSTFAGFSVDSFTPDQARITFIVKSSGSPTGYSGVPTTLQWDGKDWKIRLLDNGAFFAGSPTTPAAGSFVSWGAS